MEKLKKLKVVTPPLPWDRARLRAGDGERVILLHGLWRGVQAMEPMARFLNGHGYETVNLPYPSVTLALAEIVARLDAQLAALDLPAKKTHFVTHSLGGIVLRQWLADARRPQSIGRAVMLAPPSQGSEIIDWLEGSWLGPFALGPAGMALGSRRVPAEIPEISGVDVGVLMGSSQNIRLFKSMLERENDGIVSVERGRLTGMADFKVLPADHTFFAANPEAHARTLRFLQKGKFSSEK